LEYANQFHESGLFDAASPEFIHYGENAGFLQSNAALANSGLNSVNDTFYEHQWGLKNTGQNNGIPEIDIKAEQAWTITKGNYNGNIIKVAVYDDGFEMNHPDLAGNLLPGTIG